MSTDGASKAAVSVHLVGGDYLTSLALRQLLGGVDFISVAGVSTDVSEALKQVRGGRTDLLLIDAALGEAAVENGIKILKKDAHAPRVVVLSGRPGGDPLPMVCNFFAAGAAGYLRRDLALEDVAVALRIIHRGGLVNAVFTSCAHPYKELTALDNPIAERFKQLNARDRKIVAALVDGQTNTEIARSMNVSEATVKSRIAQLMQALGLQNRVQVAVAAARASLS